MSQTTQDIGTTPGEFLYDGRDTVSRSRLLEGVADRLDRGRNLLAKHWVPLAGCIVLSLMARGQSLFDPLYSFDTYSSIYYGSKALYGLVLSQGRFGLALLLWVRDAIGYSGFDVAVSAIILSVVLFAVSGLVFATAIFKSASRSEVFIFSAMFALHPFGTEFYTFSDATLNCLISILVAALGTAAAVRIERPALAALVGSVLIVFALSIYQVVVAHVLVACVFVIVARLASSDPSETLFSPSTLKSARALGIALASVAIYLAVSAIVARIVAIPVDARNDVSGLVHVRQKLAIMLEGVRLAVWPGPGLVSPFATVLLVGLFVASAVLLLRPLVVTGRLVRAIVCVALLAGALVWAAGATAAGNQQTWLVSRVLSPVALFAAGLVTMGWRSASTTIRFALGIALALLWFSYEGSSNRILMDQRRLNLWDAQQVNRILGRLEQKPGYAQMRSLDIIGGGWRRSVPLSTTGGDMNVSALAVSVAKLGLVEQATGVHFDEPKPAEVEKAHNYCKGAADWPADESVTIVGDLGVVCLTKEP